ncbi:MAG: cell division protein ZapA [Clostridiales bacterium]|nr:cell division protein ZapA [Clostridiales bacterium]
MDDKTKVSVKIYGQEYKISGDAPKEYILQLANYVDGKIVEMAKTVKQYTTPMITVLAAINIADEYFKAKKKFNEIQSEINKLHIEIKNKNNFLEKAKESYIQYKQESEKYRQQALDLEKQLEEQSVKYNEILSENENLKSTNSEFNNETDTLQQKIKQLEAELKDQKSEIDELKQINLELENNYFDTQMLNVQLKKELEDITKNKD